ncbi:MAG: DUF2460 domain-containing protein [Nitratireductor sp.]
MPVLQAFHEIRFPFALALGGSAGPVTRTEIVQLASGREQRNGRWARARRRFDAGSAIRTFAQLQEIASFFEARHGRLYGFRFRDPLDHKSCPASRAITPLDQLIGTGDAATASFQLVKTGEIGAPQRVISKPVGGTVRVAVDGIEQDADTAFTLDTASGEITFATAHVPAQGAQITAGFEFDVPVRFDSDELVINLAAFGAGDIPSIPIIEIVQ